MNEPTLTSSPASEASPWLPLGPVSERLPSAKSNPIAKKFSKKGSGQFLRTLKVSDAAKQVRNNLPHQIQHGYSGTFALQRCIPISPDLTEGDTPELICLQQVFPASPQARPGSDEAQRMTVGSGRKLFESLVKHSRLSPCSKTLSASVLLSKEWSSSICFLKWKASATKSCRRLMFQLAPLVPDTSGDESSLLPTLSAGELNGGGSSADTRKEGGHHVRLRDALLMPTLSARDWKSEKSNQHDKNSRPLSEFVGKESSGLKLTSAFCERFMGFPEGWTAIDALESMPSETPSSRRRSIRSSKQSETP